MKANQTLLQFISIKIINLFLDFYIVDFVINFIKNKVLIQKVMGTGIFLSPKIMSIIIDRYSFKMSWYVIGLVGMVAFFGMICISYLEKKIKVANIDSDIKIEEV